ncbi:membrane fusion protein, multidrug efflux system [Enhydrobacter aerosaccus]|uniref:Membrane fusion protein, multidrug efflux system n=1 Tax=Enhydrobacter aerosaccus TaxID=225324 RepID=A0A1T4NXA1_9HYPH|nr:HlyD family secretion protein [Enhydrobacter aerosaccus]SJZ83428.1 membrane fusion protein, multidrug efflux system [Enhydrobacter aerosaccus]
MAPDEGRRAAAREKDDRDSSSRPDWHDHDERAALDEEQKQDHEEAEKKRSFFRRPLVRLGALVVIAAVVAAGVLWWLNARHYEDTDDAFVDTHIVHLSPQISGRVTKVYVNDNEQVHTGQPLVEIDPADVQAKLAQVEAQQEQAETQYQQALATEKGAAAQAENASRDLERYRTLQKTTPQAVAQQQLDQAVATATNTAAQLAAARAQIASSKALIDVYKAQVEAAKLDLSYTHIVSPIDGHVAQRSVAVGNYISPGQELMAIVPLQLWVTANFKETQLTYMRPGQAATIEVDACPGEDIRGHVDSVQRGAGQAFGILPPENATGNYVKVVQRVPVKIVLDNPPKDCLLGPGMSVVPTVKVR